MLVTATSPAGQAVPLGPIGSVDIRMDLDLPADTFTGVFYPAAQPAEIAKIQVTSDDGARYWFQGPVDEQTFGAGPQGKRLVVKARSMAAKLLDNETAPAVYSDTWVTTVIRNHVAPYGIEGYEGNPFSVPGAFFVQRGETQWQAVTRFFDKAQLAPPRVTPWNTLYFSSYPIFSLPVVNLGDTAAGEPACAAAHRTIRRKEVLEKIELVSQANVTGSILENEQAANRDIQRHRYLMYRNSPLELEMKSHYLIQAGNRASDILSIRCLGELPVTAGQAVRLKDPLLGTVSGYTVCRLHHRSDRAGRYTDLDCCRFDTSP